MIAGMAALVNAVQTNCDIADARHARDVSLCTYLLGMREFYRWEHQLPYGASPPRDDVGRWIAEREARWEQIVDDNFVAVPVAGREFDPFAAHQVNAALAGSGLVYGAGIGRFRKPHFFLGQLDREERRGAAQLLVCGCEYARDVSAIPAASQGGTLIVRREALRQWLWEKAEGWNVKQQDGALKSALLGYGFDVDPQAAIERMSEREIETLVLHEEGELAASRLLGEEWARKLASFSGKRAELLARAVKDNLADCLVTLPGLLQRNAEDSLHFWFSTFDGLRRDLFPRLVEAYEKVGQPSPSIPAPRPTAGFAQPAGSGGAKRASRNPAFAPEGEGRQSASFSFQEKGGGMRGDTALLAEAVAAGRVHFAALGLRLLDMDEAAIAALSHEVAAIAL